MAKIQRSETQNTGIVFDGDDTLWSTEPLYDEARSKARGLVVASGLDGGEWEQLERKIDVQNVAIFGFGVDRFPTSCVQAYDELSRRANIRADPVISQSVRAIAQSVFNADPTVFPSAKNALEILRARGFRLALLTKGVPEIQWRRIESSGLSPYFEIIRVVAEKTPESIREVLSCLSVTVDRGWMVGNSIRSDILPAIAAGLRAVWIQSHVWEYERAFDGSIDNHALVASTIEEVPDLIILDQA